MVPAESARNFGLNKTNILETHDVKNGFISSYLYNGKMKTKSIETGANNIVETTASNKFAPNGHKH